MTSLRPSLVLYGAAMVAELAGVYVLLGAIGLAFVTGPVVWVLIMFAYTVGLGSALWASVSSGNTSHGAVIKVAVAILAVGGTAVAAYGGLQGDLVGGGIRGILGAGLYTAGAALAWWLGATVVGGTVSYGRHAARFQVGVLFLLAFSAVPGSPVLAAVVFFVAGTGALALARWESSLLDRQGVLQPMAGGTIAAAVLMVLVAAAVLFLALSPGVVRSLTGAVSAGIRWLWVDLPPLVSEVDSSFRFSCNFQPRDEGFPLPGPGPDGEPTPLSAGAIWTLSALLAAAAIAGIIIAIIKLRNRTKQIRPPAPQVAFAATRTSLLYWLREFVRAVMAGLRAAFERLGSWRPFTMRGDRQTTTPPGTLRAIYRDLMSLAAAQGMPKAISQTPLEYLEALRRAFPPAAGQLETITYEYVAARYSRGSLGDTNTQRVRDAWLELQTLILR